MVTGAQRPIAQNRKARHEYMIESTLEAGVVLTGSEVKSLRQGRCSIGEAYAYEEGSELYLRGMHIATYDAANLRNHDPLRPRKLLVHRREMVKLAGQIQRGGYTLVPLSIYFNDRGIAKVELAVASGKRKADKRQSDKKRDWDRQKARILREQRD